MGSQGQFQPLAIILYFNCFFHTIALSTAPWVSGGAAVYLSSWKQWALWRRGRKGDHSSRDASGVLVVVYLLSCVWLFFDPMSCSLPGSSFIGISKARILEWVVICFSRGIFPTQGSNPRLLHWQADSSRLNHLGSPVEDLHHSKNWTSFPDYGGVS